jgi:hypothetical protein
VVRHRVAPLARDVWALREGLTAYDARIWPFRARSTLAS